LRRDGRQTGLRLSTWNNSGSRETDEVPCPRVLLETSDPAGEHATGASAQITTASETMDKVGLGCILLDARGGPFVSALD